MIILYFYLLFATTTAITAIYEILMPVLKRRFAEGFPVENMLATYIAFFFLTVLIAPLIFFSCIIPSMGERFRSSLYDGLFPKE